MTAPKLTTEPQPASRKVYTHGEQHPDIRVPFREITLSDPKTPTVRVYDTSGPYTDPDVDIDVRKGLVPIRAAWIAATPTMIRP